MHAQYAIEGRNYVLFQFAANSGNFIRRAIAVVTVANGVPSSPTSATPAMLVRLAAGWQTARVGRNDGIVCTSLMGSSRWANATV